MTSLDGYILKLLDEYSKTEDAGEKDFLIKKYDTAKMMLAYQNSTVEDAPIATFGDLEDSVAKNWEGKAVVCVKNIGCETRFEEGVEYLCIKDYGKIKNGSNEEAIIVIDMLGDETYIQRERFLCKD